MEVRAARRDPIRRGGEHLHHLAFVLALAPPPVADPKPLARERTRHPDPSALDLPDPAPATVHRPDVDLDRLGRKRESPSAHTSPMFVARAPRCLWNCGNIGDVFTRKYQRKNLGFFRICGPHGPRDAEGAAVPASKRLSGVRPATASRLASAAGHRCNMRAIAAHGRPRTPEGGPGPAPPPAPGRAHGQAPRRRAAPGAGRSEGE